MASSDLHVVLVEPEIHWNTGNAGRTVLAAGASLHLVEPLGFSIDAKQVRRAGLDYWARVPVTLWPDWTSLEQELPSMGEAFFVSPEAERTLWEATFPAPCVLVFGRETQGLPAPLRRRHRDRMISIPMKDETLRSLNLSTAVGIVLYEVLRQRAASSG
jgi:tRNA (cytidine/uridine-2'-O-)-methyltransferase